jgi:hypothetical protein
VEKDEKKKAEMKARKRSLHAAPLLRSMPKSWRAEEHVAGLRIWAFAGQLRVAFLRDLPVDCVFIYLLNKTL